jgi:hypothetical protein
VGLLLSYIYNLRFPEKLGAPIVNLYLPTVADNDPLRGKAPDFCLLFGVYLLHKFHANLAKHFKGKM